MNNSDGQINGRLANNHNLRYFYKRILYNLSYFCPTSIAASFGPDSYRDSDLRTSGLPDFRTSGLSDFPTSGLSDFRTFRLSDFPTNN